MNSTPLFLGLACVYSSNGGMEEKKKSTRVISSCLVYSGSLCIQRATLSLLPDERKELNSFFKKNYGDISWGIRALSL